MRTFFSLALLATVALPVAAQARDGHGYRDDASAQDGQRRSFENRGGDRAARAQQPQPQAAAPVAAPAAAASRAERSYGGRSDRQRSDAGGASAQASVNFIRDDDRDQRQREANAALQAQAQFQRDGNRNRGNTAGQAAPQSRPDQYRGEGYQGDRDNRGSARRDNRNSYDRTDRGGYDRNGRGNDFNRNNSGFNSSDRNRNWDRNWRQDGRFNWQRARERNRSAFRLPRYYAPYGWNYGYRSFGIGSTLFHGLFAQNYWISDPYAYSLPPAYWPYQWVRYYDDALLVDTRSGYVVDSIPGIFW